MVRSVFPLARQRGAAELRLLTGVPCSGDDADRPATLEHVPPFLLLDGLRLEPGDPARHHRGGAAQLVVGPGDLHVCLCRHLVPGLLSGAVATSVRPTDRLVSGRWDAE